MNIKGIYKAIIDNAVRGKVMLYGELNDAYIGIGLDAYGAFFIPKSQFIFDPEKLQPKSCAFSRVLPEQEPTPATFTNDMKVLDSGATLRKLTTGKSWTWVNTDRIKYFDKKAEYRMTTDVGAILVYEHDILVGMFMPSRKAEGEK